MEGKRKELHSKLRYNSADVRTKFNPCAKIVRNFLTSFSMPMMYVCTDVQMYRCTNVHTAVCTFSRMAICTYGVASQWRKGTISTRPSIQTALWQYVHAAKWTLAHMYERPNNAQKATCTHVQKDGRTHVHMDKCTYGHTPKCVYTKCVYTEKRTARCVFVYTNLRFGTQKPLATSGRWRPKRLLPSRNRTEINMKDHE